MDSRQQTSRHYTIFIYYFFMLFNNTIRMFYSLFVFCFYYKIIGLSFLNLAGRGLTRFWPGGMGRAWASKVREGHGPNINGLCRAKFQFAGLGLAGLDKCLRAWAGPGF